MEIHGLGQHEERVGVETANQFLPVVVEIGLHLIAAPRLEFFLLAHRFATESTIEDLGRAVGDLGDLPGQCQAMPGTVAGFGVVVPAITPFRILDDRHPLHGAPADLLRTGRSDGCNRDERLHEVGVHRAPLEHLHSAHRATHNREPVRQIEMVHQHVLGADNVANGDLREGGAVGLAGLRIDRRRASRALATAEHVGAHHEVLIGVDRLVGTDQVLPPAVGGMTGTHLARSMRVTGERMGDEHGVTAFVIKRTPGFVGDGHLGKHTPTFEHEGPLATDLGERTVADRIALTPGTRGGQAAEKRREAS